MKKHCALFVFTMIFSSFAFADSEMYRDFRSDTGRYNQYKVKGYSIQPPQPVGWQYRGCRQGDYNCMQRYGSRVDDGRRYYMSDDTRPNDAERELTRDIR